MPGEVFPVRWMFTLAGYYLRLPTPPQGAPQKYAPTRLAPPFATVPLLCPPGHSSTAIRVSTLGERRCRVPNQCPSTCPSSLQLPVEPRRHYAASASAALHDSPSLATSPAFSSTPAAPCWSGRPLGRSSAAGTSRGGGSHPGSPIHAGSRIRSDTPGGHFVDALHFAQLQSPLFFACLSQQYPMV